MTKPPQDLVPTDSLPPTSTSSSPTPATLIPSNSQTIHPTTPITAGHQPPFASQLRGLQPHAALKLLFQLHSPTTPPSSATSTPAAPPMPSSPSTPTCWPAAFVPTGIRCPGCWRRRASQATSPARRLCMGTL